MPTYDYECLECGKKFEAFQRMSDLPLNNCPMCKGKAKRLISAGCGIIFKGSGFYATDYKNKNTSNKEKKNEDAPCSGCKQDSCATAKDSNKK